MSSDSVCANGIRIAPVGLVAHVKPARAKGPQTRNAARRDSSTWALLSRSLGPGLITGAADDDPSGIATYSQIGAQFGMSMLWTVVLAYPFMAAIQEVSAWIARVTGYGIIKNLKTYYPISISYLTVSLLVVANVVNLSADVAAMTHVLCLSIGGSTLIYAVFFGTISVAAAVFISYTNFGRVMKWATSILFVYVLTAFFAKISLRDMLTGALVPTVRLDRNHLAALTAVLGTTISPYLFFWQAAQEVEEQNAAPGEQPLRRAPTQASRQLKPMRIDTYFGMAVSNVIAFFIVLDAGTLLHGHGANDITTATQAAEALRPIAGELAFVLFGLGIIGTGLLAIPALAGSVAYALAELRSWPYGLSQALAKARAFYTVVGLVTFVGVILSLSPVSPMKALFWSAVINGIAAGPIMVILMFMVTNRRLTKGLRFPRPQWALAWTATAIMLFVSAGTVVSLFLK